MHLATVQPRPFDAVILSLRSVDETLCTSGFGDLTALERAVFHRISLSESGSVLHAPTEADLLATAPLLIERAVDRLEGFGLAIRQKQPSTGLTITRLTTAGVSLMCRLRGAAGY